MKTVLVLEDENGVLKLLRHMLKHYILHEATGAEQALWCFKENQQTIGLLIADVTLPTSSGIQVALRLRSEAPDLPIILTSGYPLSGWSACDSADLARLGADSAIILQKPFQSQLLLNSVRKFIGSPQTEAAKFA
jgi:DNA-binding NtrC family response regulator